MSVDLFSAIPVAQRERARSALTAAFGTAPITAIAAVTGGVSGASTWRVDTGGRRYLLRIEGTPSPLRNPHQYVSMRVAAEAGIAPRILHIDEASRVALIDFVEQRPLHGFPGGAPALAQALGELLRRVQSTPAFSEFVTYPNIVTRLWAHVCRTGLFAPGVLDPVTEHLTRLCEAYVWEQQGLLSSHNDPVPNNILFDGSRLWLIDWESAYRNDPLVDVAIALDNLARTPELESVLLRAWLGREPDEGMNIRLGQVRALTRLYYAGVMLSASATVPRPAPDADLVAPTLQEFQLAVADGRLKPGALATRHIIGKMLVSSFLTGAMPPGLGAAV